MDLRKTRRSPNRRRLAALLAAGLLAFASCGAAWAGEFRPGRGGARAAMRGGPFGGRGGMRGERMGQQGRQAEQLQQQVAPVAVERPPEAPSVDRGGRPGRLTPDERRALRQQINDAGRDIYRAPRP
jgi:hypothetical protein